MTWLRKVKGWGQDQRGVGLVESLVAVAILGVAVVAFVMALSVGTVAVGECNQQIVVQSLMRTQLEYIKSCDYDTTYSIVGAPGGYDISVEVDSIPDADDEIQKITVTISFEGENILSVEDYKVNRL